MKNLHNFERLQTMVPLLQNPTEFATKAGYFLDDMDEMKHLARIIVTMKRLSESFTDIRTEDWNKQQTKQNWAKYCYQNYGIDESGRVASPVSIIALAATSRGKGMVVRICTGNTITPPARQRWIPTTAADELMASIFMQELTKARGNQLHEEEDMDFILTVNMHESFEHSKVFHVMNGIVVHKAEIIPLMSYDRSHFAYDGMNFNVAETVQWLQSFVEKMKEKHIAQATKEAKRDDMFDAMRNAAQANWWPEGSRPGSIVPRSETKARELAMGYGMGTEDFLVKTKDMKQFIGASDFVNTKDMKQFIGASDFVNTNATKEKETKTMNLTQKATAFFGNLKAIGADLLRVQRGRATLHSAKRIIFSALPIKWGFLARVTGKAKKVENHPLTDLALAFALHGATNFAISDTAKREKYLKYTEEMLVAAGYSASLQMLPVEDMLDKIFSGVGESEAVTKLKDMLAEKVETVSELTAAGPSGK